MRDLLIREEALVLVFAGDRRDLLHLFRLADDSDTAIEGYIDAGLVLVALDGDQIVGHLQLVEAETWQINSVAVIPSHSRRSIGRSLVETACKLARASGARMIEVATATADVNALRFYQRLGFRMRRIERDIFTPVAGYPVNATIDGIRVLDRVWLDRAIEQSCNRIAAPT